MQNRKRKVKIIALTGGIGSGKSFALSVIKGAGFYTVSCDEIVAELYKKRWFLKELKKIFPFAVYGKIRLKVDKKIIAKEVFVNGEKREKLNALTHSKVLERALKKSNKHGRKKGVAFVEVPLLFEGDFQGDFDGVVVIKRDVVERIKCVIMRSNLKKEQVESRINAQIDYDNFDFSKYIVINNNGNKIEFEKSVLNTLKRICKK